MEILDEIQACITRHAVGAGASVVGIGQRWGAGSGIVLGRGRVLTNAHNVRADQVTVTLPDGRAAEGRVAGQDLDGDLAVIDVETGDVPTLDWAGGASVAIGTPVFALSNPGGRGLRVTFGFVSAVDRSFRGPRGRRIAGSVEHTAPLPPGSSGGPLLDADGHLLGINTNRLGEGFYLALPADEALRNRADALARGQTATPPQLGISIAPAHVASRLRRAVGLPDAEGLLIQQVAEDSPAARAGLAPGDLIVAAAGRPVAVVDDLYDTLRAAAPDSTLELSVVRGTDGRTVHVVFSPEAENA